MEQGKIEKLFAEKGYGFVSDRYKATHFFHCTQVADFDTLCVGEWVEFAFGEGKNGRQCAVALRRI